ncbi:hypothetical protein ACHAPV_009459 [Trichoderma viride]
MAPPLQGAIGAVDAAPGVSFYTPRQEPAAGTAKDKDCPSLFKPISIGGMTIHNRIVVSPMCQYSSPDGFVTQWHKSLINSFSARGPGLVFMEAHSVSAHGRITPSDAGLWSDAHIEPLAEIVEFAHSQGVKIGIQLQHAGRKASRLSPWLEMTKVSKDKDFGWPDKVISCSPLPFSPDTCLPREMTIADIESLKKDWVAAAKRALKAGFDAAFGFLLHSFLSPAANQRKDNYGGSFENRIRLLIEIVDLVKAEVPAGFPIGVRMPATDHLEYDESIPQWNLEQSAKLAKILAEHGVDYIDVSSGALDRRQKMKYGKGYQVDLAKQIKKALAGTSVIVGVSGSVIKGQQAQDILDSSAADVVVSGRAFVKNPNLVWQWAEELGVDIHVASQFGWGFGKARGLPSKQKSNPKSKI